MGELPLAALKERLSPGAVFHAGDSVSPSNLSLQRLEFWTDEKGLVYIPFKTLNRDIDAGEEGLWDYPYTDGAAGWQYSFNDARSGLTNIKDKSHWHQDLMLTWSRDRLVDPSPRVLNFLRFPRVLRRTGANVDQPLIHCWSNPDFSRDEFRLQILWRRQFRQQRCCLSSNVWRITKWITNDNPDGDWADLISSNLCTCM